jgi:hypothetical protein
VALAAADGTGARKSRPRPRIHQHLQGVVAHAQGPPGAVGDLRLGTAGLLGVERPRALDVELVADPERPGARRDVGGLPPRLDPGRDLPDRLEVSRQLGLQGVRDALELRGAEPLRLRHQRDHLSRHPAREQSITPGREATPPRRAPADEGAALRQRRALVN